MFSWHTPAEPAARGALSQNLAVLRKRHESCPVLSQLPQVKTMLKLPWPLLKVYLRILSLIGRGTSYFVQNEITIILPGDTRRTTSELQWPCRSKATHFWRRQIGSLKTQNVSYFSIFTI